MATRKVRFKGENTYQIVAPAVTLNHNMPVGMPTGPSPPIPSSTDVNWDVDFENKGGKQVMADVVTENHYGTLPAQNSQTSQTSQTSPSEPNTRHCWASDSDKAHLSIGTWNGKVVRWGPNKKHHLTYKIDETSFSESSPFTAQEVKEWMETAAAIWNQACDVTFSFTEEENALFVVRFEGQPKAWPNLLAQSFFPDSHERVMRLYPYFKGDHREREVSVLVHELGHILGFRHEHIWLPGAKEGIANAFKLTEYDSGSIMHYQDKLPEGLTPLDIIGARLVYGHPVDSVVDID